MEEYAKLNDIEIPPEGDDDFPVVYGFVWDANFLTLHMIKANCDNQVVFEIDTFH